MEPSQTPKYFYYLGGRKMMLSMLVLFVGGMVEMHADSGISENFTYLLLGLAGLFVTGNVAATISSLKGNASQPEVHPAVEEALVAQANAIRTNSEAIGQNAKDIASAIGLIEGVKKLVTASIKAERK